jgi:hypothetical protein
MALKVVGAGLGRTGTLSLKIALEKLLGAPCYHMLEVFKNQAHVPIWTAASKGDAVDWDALLEGYAAAVDWPASAFWHQLSEHYPNALILLSVRDPEKWWESVSSTIFPSSCNAEGPWRDMIDSLFGNTFTTSFDDREACIAAFERHYADVRATAPRDRLLEWRPGDGWEPICAALKLPVPGEPFPHVNTREEWAQHGGPRALLQQQS